MNICVYGGSSNEIREEFIQAGELLGKEMAKRGHTLVFGAGAEGLMGAVSRGVIQGGGKCVGIVPTFFTDGRSVLCENCTEMIYTETMRERKQKMEDRSDAFIMTPGGIGTFEEFFEIFTLRQLERHQKPIAVLNTAGYYDDLYAMLEKTVNEGFLFPNNMEMVHFFEDVTELLDDLENAN